ncbi:MAG: hypothetical protein M3464_03210 [Chloroflexota bacterium]|nr:hypothetical protein [Chloroflexota bacterium]
MTYAKVNDIRIYIDEQTPGELLELLQVVHLHHRLRPICLGSSGADNR